MYGATFFPHVLFLIIRRVVCGKHFIRGVSCYTVCKFKVIPRCFAALVVASRRADGYLVSIDRVRWILENGLCICNDLDGIINTDPVLGYGVRVLVDGVRLRLDAGHVVTDGVCFSECYFFEVCPRMIPSVLTLSPWPCYHLEDF